MVWHILIVEDEDWASESLQDMLAQLLPATMPIISIQRTVHDAVSWLERNRVDLIFMDVHLADGNSLAIFKQVTVKAPVIFTTAYEHYALEAFRHQGYAYLLKPFDLEDLDQALDKVRSLLPREIPTYKSRFLVKYGIHLKSLSVGEIAYFMAEDKTLYAVENDGNQYIIEESLMSLVSKLDPQLFYQINRKFVIQVQAIRSMVKITRGRIKLELNPSAAVDVIVSEDRSQSFQLWLDR